MFYQIDENNIINLNFCVRIEKVINENECSIRFYYENKDYDYESFMILPDCDNICEKQFESFINYQINEEKNEQL